jgi:hypothetical protein
VSRLSAGAADAGAISPICIITQMGAITMAEKSWRSRLSSSMSGEVVVVGILATAFSLLGGFAALSFDSRRFAYMLMCGLAAMAMGCGLGFLFAIPKVIQGAAAAYSGGGASGTAEYWVSQSAYHQAVNTNLTEISDWLTKIVVGLGLVELKSVPWAFRHISLWVAKGLDGSAGSQTFGGALVLYFGIVGFIWFYVQTRLYLARALANAERDLAEAAEAHAHTMQAVRKQEALATGGQEPTGH